MPAENSDKYLGKTPTFPGIKVYIVDNLPVYTVGKRFTATTKGVVQFAGIIQYTAPIGQKSLRIVVCGTDTDKTHAIEKKP